MIHHLPPVRMRLEYFTQPLPEISDSVEIFDYPRHVLRFDSIRELKQPGYRYIRSHCTFIRAGIFPSYLSSWKRKNIPVFSDGISNLECVNLE